MPNQLPLQFGKGREGYDVVYAVRQKRKEGVFKRFCYWAFYRLMAGMVPFDMPLDSGDFCLMDRRMVDIIKAMPERNRFVRGIRAWAGFKQTGVVYKRHARAAGEPKYGFRKLFKLAWDGLFSFSSKPLRMATYLGFWVSAFAFLGVIFTFLQKVFARQFAQIGLEPWPHGMSTVMISILFLGGVRLIGIGILGEYIGRIYDEVKGRPLWIIQDSAGIKNRDKFHQKRTLFRFTSQLVIPSPRAVIEVMTSTPPRPCRQLLWKLFFVAAVMFALAVMTISTQGFWIDEACTGTIAVQPTLASWWQAMLDDTGSTTQMPLYTIYTWSWGKIFGHNEWWLRLSNLPWLALGLPANQPPPDLLILSKPDIHDKNGLMRSYLANHHCVVLQTLPSFTLWRKNVD